MLSLLLNFSSIAGTISKAVSILILTLIYCFEQNKLITVTSDTNILQAMQLMTGK